MTKWKIYNEDAVEWARQYEKGKFHALLTDAPYHLTTITKRFGKNGSAPAKFGKDGVFQRASKGFMGTQWDGGDVAFRPETWEAFGQVLYPGAFGMAFSASRNWHRMAVAIEDAGFILHPTMFFLWVQGQGFPKATRVKGHEEFDGHRYGLQALKPAVEPIIVFQKPYEGKPVEKITSTGAGTLNIDGGRIPLASGDEYTINEFEDGMKPWGNGAGHKYKSKKIKEDSRLGGKGKWKTDKAAKTVYEGGYEGVDISSSPLGRYPSNLVISKDINGLDEQSRFFYQVETQLDESDPFLYCAKVSPKERNAGLEEYEEVERRTMGTGMVGVSGDRISGKGTPIEMGVTKTRNPHPTLKPIDLCKYLATLLLPPVEYAPRRIFVPFSGVASEMIGAGLAGWEHVVGVEFDKENGYVDIAEKRLEYWLKGKQNGI